MAYPTKPTGNDLIPEYNFANGGTVGTISQTEYELGYEDFVTPVAGSVLGDKPLAEDFNLLMRQSLMNARYSFAKASCLADYRAISYYGTTGTALQTYITEMGSTKAGIVIDTTVAITSSISVPSNIHVICTENGVFNISAAQTLTINGQFDAPATQQCFTGSGSVSFGVSSKTQQVRAEWFGGVFGSKPSSAIQGQYWWDDANSKIEVYNSSTSWTDEVCNKMSNPDTGWSAPTGTTDKSTFATSTVTTEDLAQFVKGIYEALLAKNILSEST